jgi:hypothetical protein
VHPSVVVIIAMEISDRMFIAKMSSKAGSAPSAIATSTD